jgi:uncharacterized protein
MLIGPFVGGPISIGNIGLDLVRHCEGLTIDESKHWIQERYGAKHTPMVDQLASLVNNGRLRSPAPGVGETEAFPAVNVFTLCLTHACQLACRYCFARDPREDPHNGDMTFETACAAIKFILDESVRSGISAVAINYNSTGEVLLRKDLMLQVTAYAKEQSEAAGICLPFGFGTNGVLLDLAVIEEMKEAGISFAMSWDGPPEIHNANRIHPDGTGTYDEVLTAFKTVMEHGWIKPLSCGAHLSASNTDFVATFSHLYDMGVRPITMKPIRDGGSGQGVSEESLPSYKAGYADFAEYLLRTDAYHTERLCTVHCLDYFWRFVLRVARSEFNVWRCPAARTAMCIDTNGDIYPCQDFVGMPEYKIGDVFSGIDESSRRVYMEELLCYKMEPCKECWARYFCGGGCHSQSAKALGDLHVPYTPDCDLNKYLIELAAYFVARISKERPSLLQHATNFSELEPLPDPRPIALCHYTEVEPTFSGSSDVWQSPDPIVLNSASQAGGYRKWRGPEDLSARIHLRWNEQGLYILAEVVDDIFVTAPSPNWEWWFYDSLQIGLDPHNDGGFSENPWRLTGGDCEFGVAQIENTTCCFDCHIDRSQPTDAWSGAVERKDKTIQYKIAIPWKSIPDFAPKAGAECGFTLVVNDSDGAGRSWLRWAPGLTALRRPEGFGLLKLV